MLVLVAALLLAAGIVQGQDDTTCPVIVQSALDLAGDACGATGRNEICYGNVNLQADPQDGVDSLALDNPGDIEDVAAIRRVQLSSMNTAVSEWGIALMRLQANLPDALPGQNVLFVLFGDVAIESAVPTNAEPLTETVRATSGVNLRQGPSTSTAVVGGLAAGPNRGFRAQYEAVS